MFMTNMLLDIKKEVKSKGTKERAQVAQRYFKTGKGQYGEGDIFYGITVPESRKLAVKYKDIPLKDIEQLLKSKIHEERLIALLILVHNYKVNPENREEIYNFYLSNTQYINNWDLVDLSSHKIVGQYLLDKNRDILYKLSKSSNLWEKRISIISTFAFIANNDLKDTIKLAEILLHDKHDLMHKAVGWALREIGKKDENALKDFLKKHYKSMPRTTLRYAIERFPENTRKAYLKGEF